MVNKIFITDRNEFVGKYFTAHEFWKAANPDHDFYFPEPLIQAADTLREYFQCPIIITSTSRPNDTFGFHRYDMACDFVSRSKDIPELFKIEVEKYIRGEKSELITELREIGITGFGVEQVCIHLDIRNDHYARRDDFGGYTAFEYKQDNDGNVLINRAI